MNTVITDLKGIVKSKKAIGIPEATIRIFLKERLQDFSLGFIYNHPEYSKLAFYGGTCLRKLYGLNRLSEDLDFEIQDSVKLNSLPKDIESYFVNRLGVSSTQVTKQGIHNIFRVTLKFPILYELGISPNRSEKLHIKLEVNQKATGKYKTEITPYTHANVSVLLRHYPLETLMAGKISAALDRVYRKGDTGILVKGRDYYDLIWYMQKGVVPNERKLKDVNSRYSVKKVFELLDEKMAMIKSSDLLIDLEPFFEEKRFVKGWCDNFHVLYKKYRVGY